MPHGSPLSIGWRACSGWGLLVCMLSMLAGGAVEWYRLRLFAQGRVLTAQVLEGLGSRVWVATSVLPHSLPMQGACAVAESMGGSLLLG